MSAGAGAAPPSDSVAGAWWRGAVIYECHLPSFRDGNGDGVGDLQGLIDSLGYLSDILGVDAVWTGPFYASPLLDQGFDVSDYLQVEPVFGTLEIFDRLLTEAHARGIKIIVDYIPSHTSDQHPWFLESRSSLTNPRRDWYVWRDSKPDGSLPNNWTSEAGGSVWELDPPTGQYYLHSHLKEQPDLNWRNPQVRDALFEVLRYWLGRGADGVRIDVAHMLMKDPELRDNPEVAAGAHNPYDLQHPDFGTQIHLYDRRHPDTHQVMTQIRAIVDEYPDAVTIAEIEAMPWADWAAYYGADLGGMHLPFPFRLIETPWRADLLRAELEGLYAALPTGAWPIVALGNHDRMRLATRLGPAQARVAAVLLLTLAATPCLLYGDELGMADQPVPLSQQRDYFATATGGVSRDPTRTPMPWNNDVNAGFSTADPAQLWLPTAHDAAEINVDSQLAEPASSLSLYQTLVRLRGTADALRHGDITFLPCACPPSVLAYERRSESHSMVIALNLTSEPTSVTLPSTGSVVVSTTGACRGSTGATLHLGADEGVVIEVKEGMHSHEDH
ncbi:MAG: alpha-glucosidase C-terminal domain-containing protein [Nocardioidaceae bacterium]|nr:alpha-glucosidase C-terminal domain-containing protein [Nocardioidaceae bacterium]